MTPSLRIDRVFVGVGRIAISSGTSHKGTFKRINAMLTALYAMGDLDTLKAIKDGIFPPLVVLYHYERGKLNLLTRDTAANLLTALDRFTSTYACSDGYRDDLKTSVRHIRKVPGAKTATVQHLPALLRQMKAGFHERPVAFNRLRAHMLAFASELTGKHSTLWIEVTRINRFTKAEGKRPKKLIRRPLTVAELDAVCAAFKDRVIHGGRKGAKNKGNLTVKRTIFASDLVSMVEDLAYTGMRPSEYWMRGEASWSHKRLPNGSKFTWIDGTKTPAAKRPACMDGFANDPTCGEQYLRKAFADATTKALGTALDLYSLRRTHAKLLEDAGIVPSRRAAYMGHGPKTVTDIYLQTNVLPFVEEDAAKVDAWIAAERERAKARPTLKLETGS